MFAVAELVLIGYDCITNIHCFNEMKAIILMVITLSYLTVFKMHLPLAR